MIAGGMASGAGVVLIDGRGHMHSINPALADVIGHAGADALVGVPFASLLTESDRPRFEALLAAGDGGDRSVPVQCVHADGHPVAMSLTVSPMRLGDGPAWLLVLHVDTDQQPAARAPDELRHPPRESMEALGMFAVGIAHDVAHVLQTISGTTRAIGVCVARSPEDLPAATALADLHHAVARGAAMSRHLLSYAQSGHRRAELLDLNAEVRTAAVMLRRLLPESVLIDTELAVQIGRVRMVRADLEQLLLNLVIEARHALDDRGTIVVRTASLGPDEVLLEVADDAGARDGIAAPRPASAAAPDERRPAIGIIRRLVQQYRGHVTIRTVPAEGTTRTVRLPVMPVIGRSVGIAEPPPEPVG